MYLQYVFSRKKSVFPTISRIHRVLPTRVIVRRQNIRITTNKEATNRAQSVSIMKPVITFDYEHKVTPIRVLVRRQNTVYVYTRSDEARHRAQCVSMNEPPITFDYKHEAVPIRVLVRRPNAVFEYTRTRMIHTSVQNVPDFTFEITMTMVVIRHVEYPVFSVRIVTSV